AHGWHNLSSEMRSFGLGAVSRLYDRVREIRAAEENKSDATPGSALVLASLYKTEADANAAYLAELGMRIKPSRSAGRSASDSAAYQAGKDFANKVNLSRQVSAPTAQKVIK